MSLSRGIRNRCGEDRFYCPPAMRRQQQQQQQQRLQSNSNKSPKSNPKASLTDSEKRIESDDGASAATTTTAPSVASSSPISTPRTNDSTNLDRFLEYTTPSVLAQHVSKPSSRGGGGGAGWRRREQKCNPYFILGDLWESFKEWSAYGAGVPLVLSGSESAVQYYVPYLSAIQLYIDPSKPEMTLRRRHGEESDADSSRDTSSDGSNEYVQGGCSQITRFNGVVGSPVDEDNTTNPPGSLVFEYLERDLPFGREPLADKIAILASRFPKLTTLRSCDLTPSSWVSVAWYPIYRIPVGSTLQNLDACFLTFHSLSTTPMRSTNTRESESPILSSKLSLPTFGMASYKLKVSVWDSNRVDPENQKVDSLQKSAENWLRGLHVNHPDYTFFVSHGSYMR